MKYKVKDNFSNYLIYENGDIYSMSAKQFLSPATNRRYPTVSLAADNGEAKVFRVHRLIAELFLKPPVISDMVVNHKDGVRWNNKASNLEWVSSSENSLHAHASGLTSRAKETVVVYPDGSTAIYASKEEAARCTGVHIMKIRRRLKKSTEGVARVDGFTFTVAAHNLSVEHVPVVWRNLRTGESGRCASIREFTEKHKLTRHIVQDRFVIPGDVVHGDGYQIYREVDFTGWVDLDPASFKDHFDRYDNRVKANHSRTAKGYSKVQIKWLHNGKVEVFDSQLALHHYINVNVTKLSQKLSTGRECILRTNTNRFFLLRYESDKPWTEIDNVYCAYAKENNSKAVKSTNIHTGEVKFYVSRGECGLDNSLNETQMHTRLSKPGKVYGDLYFEYI